MNAWMRTVGAGALLVAVAAALPAEGLYVLGGLGIKGVSGQDVSDYYGPGGTLLSGPAYYGGGATLGEGALSLGWRFGGLMALEASVSIDSGQVNSADVSYYDPNAPGPGYDTSTLTYGPMTTVGLGPVFCFGPQNWPGWRWQLGVKPEFSEITGSETLTDGVNNTTGSQNFSSSAFGGGVFLRGIYVFPSGFSLGFETGADFNYFSQLNLSGTKGDFAGNNGQALNQYGGGNAYIDNSGGYLRLIIGWSDVPNRPRPRRSRVFWDNGMGPGIAPGEAGDGQPGDTVPSMPEAQPGLGQQVPYQQQPQGPYQQPQGQYQQQQQPQYPYQQQPQYPYQPQGQPQGGQPAGGGYPYSQNYGN